MFTSAFSSFSPFPVIQRSDHDCTLSNTVALCTPRQTKAAGSMFGSTLFLSSSFASSAAGVLLLWLLLVLVFVVVVVCLVGFFYFLTVRSERCSSDQATAPTLGRLALGHCGAGKSCVIQILSCSKLI